MSRCNPAYRLQKPLALPGYPRRILYIHTVFTNEMGEKVSLQGYLGDSFELNGMRVIPTYHPSFALRLNDEGGREQVTRVSVVAAVPLLRAVIVRAIRDLAAR